MAHSSSEASSITNSQAHSLPYDVPVLIAGGGPVGLFSAFLLVQMGVDCRIIDRSQEASHLSKALGIQARTLEILEMTNLIQDFLAQGEPLQNFHIYFGGKLTSVLPGLANTESTYNYGLFLEQFKTEGILKDNLEKLGKQLEHGWELAETRVVPAANPGEEVFVLTTIRRALSGDNTRAGESKVLGTNELSNEDSSKQYEVQVIKSRYLFAADGGRSTVRHKLNIPFPGRTLDRNIILFDGNFESQVPAGKLTLVNGNNGVAMGFFPLSNGRVRILLDAGTIDLEHPPKPEDLTVELFESLAKAVMKPNDFKVTECTWLTYYRINERRAERYSEQEHIFLLGDSAHVHSPAGGQGLNTGMQDAYNLSWKVALALNGLASRTFLETYASERIPVADNVIKLSSNLLGRALANDAISRALKRVAFTVAPYILPYLGPSEVSMLDIHYSANCINQPHKTQALPSEELRVGHRARDGPLSSIQTDGQALDHIRLHHLLKGPGIFHVIIFTSDMLTAISAQGQVSAINGIQTTNAEMLAQNIDTALAHWRSKWFYKTEKSQDLFRVHVIAGDSSAHGGRESPAVVNPAENFTGIQSSLFADRQVGQGKIYVDVKNEAHQKYGVACKHGFGAIIVVRPDGQISYRVQGAAQPAWFDVEHYFESIFSL